MSRLKGMCLPGDRVGGRWVCSPVIVWDLSHPRVWTGTSAHQASALKARASVVVGTGLCPQACGRVFRTLSADQQGFAAWGTEVDGAGS